MGAPDFARADVALAATELEGVDLLKQRLPLAIAKTGAGSIAAQFISGRTALFPDLHHHRGS